ncbi:MAG TPA: ATP-binding protein [Terriglobales bacterium]|jgi:two-component system LytT family sensor kinase|nr:ATP-binding protein [Terriglobales bacterium]
MSLSPTTLNALVPSLLLQPLVENAVRHGVSKSSAPVRIELKSNLRNSLLEIQVCDDGPGISEESSGNGVGLSNTRARLRQLYGERQSLSLDGRAGGGTIATVVLPYHPEEAASDEAAR